MAIGLVECSEDDVVVATGDRPDAPPSSERRATLTCDDAILGRGDPRWRKRSLLAGPLGFYGPARNFGEKWAVHWPRKDITFKIPTVVEGHRAVTARIAARDAKRAGLSFGTQGGYTVERSFANVRFEPCADRSPTGWPGGFVVRKVRPVRVIVQVEGSDEVFKITVGRRSEP